MRGSRLLLAVCGPALLLCRGPAARATNADDRKAIANLYARQIDGLRHKDISAFDSTLAADYKGYGPNGQVIGRDQAIAQMEQVFSVMQAGSLDGHETIKSIKFYPDGAVVVSHEILTLKAAGPNGQAHKVRMEENTRDFLVKEDDGWKVKQTRSLGGLSVKLDNKSLKLPGARHTPRRRRRR